jgi:hypothetical protein
MAHVVLLALTECGLLAADSRIAGGVLIITWTPCVRGDCCPYAIKSSSAEARHFFLEIASEYNLRSSALHLYRMLQFIVKGM